MEETGEAKKKVLSPSEIAVIVIAVVVIIPILFILIAGAKYSLASKKEMEKLDEINSIISEYSIESTVPTTAEDFKSECAIVTYEDLARNPDSMKQKKVTVKGEVTQIIDNPYGKDALRLLIIESGESDDSLDRYDRNLYCNISLPEGDGRILENDIIRIYGISKGLISYETILGSNKTIPEIDAVYYAFVTH